MLILLTKSRTVNEVQDDFNKAYPFLRLEFNTKPGLAGNSSLKQKLPASTLLVKAGLLCEGELAISDQMTVGQLERFFNDIFGIPMQVARKSGTVWLETTMTAAWTLYQQNEHGRELSMPVPKPATDLNRDICLIQ